MKRPLGTIGIALALFALVGAILLARWLLWFGPGLPDRDYAADFHAHALEINGVTAEEGAVGWAAYEAVVDAVIAADEAVSGETAWQDTTLPDSCSTSSATSPPKAPRPPRSPTSISRPKPSTTHGPASPTATARSPTTRTTARTCSGPWGQWRR